uniref:Adducin 2 (beta) n=1 Tax=Lepisosteus oculatus TaxID=7918 RepID=W5NDY9_LEPOC
MSTDALPEGPCSPSPCPSPSPHKESYIRRSSDSDPDFLRTRSAAPRLQQDFSMTEQKKRVSVILQSPVTGVLISNTNQQETKRGNSLSALWIDALLRQIVEFMASHGAPASLPISPSSLMMVTPINDLQATEPGTLVKGERLMRCKLASVYRLLDLHGWAQLSSTYLTLRVSKEQEHFLIIPRGLSFSEVTASSLVKVNVLGELVERGSTALQVDTASFHLHSAVYSARPDVRCVLHLHTPATAAVSAMKCGLLPISHEALLVGGVAYFDYNGAMEEEEDRVELQKSLGPTCKVLVLRNHGIVALGESVEEAFYRIYHIQAACEIQVSALCSAGGEQNLIQLDPEKQRPHQAGSVGWAGSTFGPLHKSRVGEHEFEALMRTMDNLGYRTGYAYRHPVLLERVKPRSEVEIPATVTAFSFEEDGVPRPALRHHTHKQQQEKTRWLNTPNSYLRISQDQASPGTKTTWLRAEEVKLSSGTAIKIENPNQFVPLFTNPQEVLETRNKIREQNRQDVKWAGPQSQLLASVIADKSRSPSADADLALAGTREESAQGPQEPPPPPEPEPPNPFSQLTDQELEEYKREVQRKQQLGQDGAEEQLVNETETPPAKSPPTSPAKTPVTSPSKTPPTESLCEDKEGKTTDVSKVAADGPPAVVLNGKEEEQGAEQELQKGMQQLSTRAETEAPPRGKTDAPPSAPTLSPEGSPSKSPSKKKKKFKAPSFLKKSKKQKEKAEA